MSEKIIAVKPCLVLWPVMINKRMMKIDRKENAVNKFNRGYACSQSILTEYCKLFDLDEETALKLSAGFAAGMRNGKTCGAVTGAIMVLGLKFGNRHCDNADGRKNVYDAVAEYTKRFEQLHGSTDCRELLGCNVGLLKVCKKPKKKTCFIQYARNI
jgi:C_GCAxxG_C_C family probable redox protein